MIVSVQETAKRTAVLENGKLKSVRLPIPNVGERLFTFEWASDGRSFTMVSDNGERTQIFFNEKNEIQSMRLPDGENVTINWSIIENISIVEDAIIGSGDSAISLFDGTRPRPRDACGAAARAARDAIIAAGATCAIAPGAGCWAAVAYAGYMVWQVRQACRA
ncbi:MAG: hypothetical protein MUC29_14695 [Pyrinomonadaceae bacterium]|nr:hypothetical protein [Pyrinomonadaceae bacterium]